MVQVAKRRYWFEPYWWSSRGRGTRTYHSDVRLPRAMTCRVCVLYNERVKEWATGSRRGRGHFHPDLPREHTRRQPWPLTKKMKGKIT